MSNQNAQLLQEEVDKLYARIEAVMGAIPDDLTIDDLDVATQLHRMNATLANMSSSLAVIAAVARPIGEVVKLIPWHVVEKVLLRWQGGTR